MEQAGNHRCLLHIRATEDARHRDRVRDKGFPRAPPLAVVREERDLESEADRSLRRRPQVRRREPYLLVQLVEETQSLGIARDVCDGHSEYRRLGGDLGGVNQVGGLGSDRLHAHEFSPPPNRTPERARAHCG